jgi:hypothetical protein
MYPTQHHKKGKKINKISFSQTVLKKKRTGCWWLMLVILVTQEAAIRKITVQSQP